jgi:dTDP-glucose 4,6-dehydratase
MILDTGAADFIGSNFVHKWLRCTGEPMISLDALTYAGSLKNLKDLMDDLRHAFVRGDIEDRELVAQLLSRHQPRDVINLAAESHVDRCIHRPDTQTDIVRTCSLLEAVRAYWESLDDTQKLNFRFLHVSTDEVCDSLTAESPPFTETHRYGPKSPYSASGETTCCGYARHVVVWATLQARTLKLHPESIEAINTAEYPVENANELQ